MDTILWILTGLMAVAFAYQLQFSSVTLSMGRELSNTGSQRGVQDAITPPWQTNFGLTVYIASAVIVGVIWWKLTFFPALGSAAIIIFGSFFARLVLPEPEGNHYRALILKSMISRYADYVRDGDALRAEAMKELLVKAGFDPDRFRKI